MSNSDGNTPPVMFVVGTAGAGKSSLVTAFQRWARFLEIDALTINLDPGAERVHYDPEFDVRDLISLAEVMDRYDLGPNGAQTATFLQTGRFSLPPSWCATETNILQQSCTGSLQKIAGPL